MDSAKQKRNISNFIDYWTSAKGSEDSECQQFWTDLCRDVLGIENTSKVLDFEKKVQGKSIDVFLENEGILIEQKSRDIDLDQKLKHGNKMLTPYEQAKEYMFLLPRSLKPYWIITCNFDKIRFYNMDEENPTDGMIEISIDEIGKNLHLFDIFTKKEHTKLYKEEQLSYKAGAIVGSLYNLIASRYKNLESDTKEQKSLNILITRIVFLLYAEDSGLLQENHAFLNYMKHIPCDRFNIALKDLFKTLDTPIEKRDQYLDDLLNAFPYINGGLFEDEDIIIPPFDESLKTELLLNASQQFDWSGISPTIFGAVFESTLNPETRREGGMHYTSVENIHKVIDPLFLDDLKEELSKIEGERVQKTRDVKLRQFQDKLASLKILDPAAGSHNFLTETYISLRKLEMRVIENLQGNQLSFIENPIKVNINQLYAIEINDFAVSVGKTALWIAEQQMMELTQEMLPNHEFQFFPIKNVPNSVCANALRIDWNDIIPAENCSYIIGNPPFKGAHAKPPRTPEQTQDLVFSFNNEKGISDLDYVCAWFAKSTDYIENNSVNIGFVATSSITQGQQPALLWNSLVKKGISINFAYKPFLWDSDSSDSAAVAVTILGISKNKETINRIYYETDYKTGAVISRHNREQINPYLINAPFILIKTNNKPICKVPEISIGNKPIDGGHYILSREEMKQFVSEEPDSSKFIFPFIGAEEFINNKERYILWLGNCSETELEKMPKCKERVNAVRDYRKNSSSKGTVKLADKPTHFHVENMPDGNSIIIPQTSSENRKYIPIGFIGPEKLCSNAVRLIPDATIYQFGVLNSTFHNAWSRVVSGRLESRYQYAGKVTYNCFPWPGINHNNLETPVEKAVSKDLRSTIEKKAQSILDCRAKYTDKTLADLYDPAKMPEELKQAHLELDKAVEKAYGVDFNGDEEKIVAYLFNLYNEIANND